MDMKVLSVKIDFIVWILSNGKILRLEKNGCCSMANQKFELFFEHKVEVQDRGQLKENIPFTLLSYGIFKVQR